MTASLPSVTAQRVALLAVIVLAATSAGFAAQAPPPAPFIVVSDDPSGLYPSGHDIVFTVTPGAGGTAADLATAAVTVLFNGTAECPVVRSMGAGALTLRVTPGQPGSYRCDVALPAVPKTAPVVVSAGAVVAPEAVRAPVPEPADFDAFWQGKKAALAAHPFTCEVKPLADDLRKPIARFEADGYECLVVGVAVPLDGVRPVQGYLARPKMAKPGGHPAILHLRAAGVSGNWCIASPWDAMNLAKEYGAIVLDINAHGLPNDQPKEFYSTIEQNELRDYKLQGARSRDSFYFVGMYARLLRSVDFLCREPAWDQRHLIAMGGSQGGGQAMAIAGLDARVSAVCVAVPAMCNFSAVLHGSTSGWPNPVGSVRGADQAEVAAAVSYCDNVNLAARSKAETLILVGLIDQVCPPQGVYAAFNNLTGRKRIIAYPHRGHTTVPKEDLWLGDEAVVWRDFITHHIAP
jgi:cephalosporin-C deacetylase-like acetyl esterase